MKIQDFQDNVTCGGFDNIFANIYKPQDIESQESRYMSAVEKFTALYPNRNDIHVYSAPGRTEIGGNHTDHQHGCVIAGAVDLDVIGVVAFHDENIIRIKSEGYDEFAVSLDDLDVHIGEKGSSEIVRGIAARFKDLGVEISGFDMYTTSNVLGGSGISSSAAFETLIATAIDSYYNNNQIGAVEIAKIGQYAENFYFGKKSGLMDARLAVREEKERSAIDKVKAAYGEKYDPMMMHDSKRDVADLLHEETEVRSVREFLRQHPEITTIELRLDNDAKGRMASVGIQNLYREKYQVCDLPPDIENGDYADMAKNNLMARTAAHRAAPCR